MHGIRLMMLQVMGKLEQTGSTCFCDFDIVMFGDLMNQFYDWRSDRKGDGLEDASCLHPCLPVIVGGEGLTW
jgi:hypothetical protein